MEWSGKATKNKSMLYKCFIALSLCGGLLQGTMNSVSCQLSKWLNFYCIYVILVQAYNAIPEQLTLESILP